ncbi:hypothetical protein TA3x_005347 [Tundrisphaera sp. TA3]|uniref:hypothetical protein n=1 Tax=Tundrisphaera sp. TA3 TaxID=3435775 RepID=UPI003EB94161
MGLAERQRLLARLATDAGLRDRFADDPAAATAELGLSPDDAGWLAALSSGPLALFAGSLIAKRRGEVAKLLPGTARALGPARFSERFRRHASDRPIPGGPRKHRDDALGFAATIGRDAGDPPWVADLARLEAGALRAHDPARRLAAVGLGHHPADLALALDSGVLPGRRPTLILWVRPRRGGRLRRLVVARPW